MTAREALGFLAGYFFLQAVCRVLISSSLQLDEAYQMLATQRWSWGYGSQGPLYTWLLKLVFAVLGPGVTGLALLKNALLFGAYLLTYLSAREVLGRQSHAAVAALALLFMPHLAWESQRDQTHLVLATVLAAATLWTLLRVARTRSLGWYGCLGLVAGAGLLSKYNFALFLAGLALATLTDRSSRQVLLHRRALLTLAVVLAVTSPHWIWAWNHPDLLVAERDAFQLGKSARGVGAAAHGLGALLLGLAQYLPVPAMLGLFCWRAPLQGEPDLARHHDARWLGRTMVWAAGLCALAIVVFRVASVRARWLQPLLVPLPIWCTYWARQRLTPGRQRALFAAAIMVGVLVLAAVNGTVLGAGWLRRPHNLNVPFDQLADQLRQAGFDGGTILSDNRRVAGNLRLQFLDSVVLAPGLPLLSRPAGKPVLIVWDATQRPEPPEGVLRFAAQVLGRSPTNASAGWVQASGRHGDPRVSRLGYLILPPR